MGSFVMNDHPAAPPPTANGWHAIMKYGTVLIFVGLSFLYLLDSGTNQDCRDIIATLWSWNIANASGGHGGRCPYFAEFSHNPSDAWIYWAFFVFWPITAFNFVSFIFMKIDKGGGFNIVERIRSLFK